MTIGGDVSFAGFTNYMKQTGNCSYNESFTFIKPVLKADFLFVNLESTFGNVKKPPKPLDKNKSVTMLAEPDAVNGLKYDHLPL